MNLYYHVILQTVLKLDLQSAIVQCVNIELLEIVKNSVSNTVLGFAKQENANGNILNEEFRNVIGIEVIPLKHYWSDGRTVIDVGQMFFLSKFCIR